jgi:hypothetical protein
MKYIFSFIAFLCSLTLTAQTTTYITKDLDTVIVTTKQVVITARIPSKTIRDVIVKDTTVSYKDTTYPSTVTTTVTKPYRQTTSTNLAPVARAGNDITITLPTSSVTLDGSASTDADGTIAIYKWTGLGGVIGSGTSRVTVTGLSEGTYTYRLTVTDDKGATHFDELLVTVKPAIIPIPGTTVNFSFNQIPYSDPDIISPGRGAEQWHNSSARIPNPTESQPIGTENSLDVYYRFEAWRLQDAQGNFTWSYFDGLIQDAINKGQKLSFGIMTYNDDGGGGTNYGGGESAYPQFLHNQMQSEGAKDVLLGGEWLPNWNSQYYINYLKSIHTAIVNRLKTQFYTPTSGINAGKRVLYGDAIYIIDVRGFGNWGEAHIGGIANDWNSQPNKPTIATLKAIIDAHTQIFDKWPLGMMIAYYDGGASGVPLFHPYPEVAWYALTARNAWGETGARRDQVGAPDGYLKAMLENNNLSYNGSPLFKTLFLEKWKNAPITGEPNPGVAPITGMADLIGQVNLYHHTSFGNGNYPDGSALPLATRNTIRAAFKRAGYRLILTGGKAVTSTGSIAITLNWQNIGITPTYENWDVVYELVSSSGAVTTLGTSSVKPKLILPATTPTVVVDTFSENVTGTYTLRMVVKDPSGYRQPAPIAIQGRSASGYYNLGTVSL